MKTDLHARTRPGKKFSVPYSGLAAAVSCTCTFLFISSGFICPENISGDIIPELSFSAIPLCVLLLSNGDRPVWRNISVFVSFISLAVFFLRISRLPAAWLAVHLKDILLACISAASVWAAAHIVARRMKNPGNRAFETASGHLPAGETNMLYLLLLTAYPAASSVLSAAGGPAAMAGTLILLPLSLGLYAGLLARLFTGRVFLFASGVQPQMQEMLVRCQVKCIEGDDASYRAIFERLTEYFENEKPYLDCDLNISGVARRLLTNKAYLSRSINLYTGRNFCQYVNWYRIRHSVGVFFEDPRLKISDLALASGFRSLVTFSMAFRLYMNDSPGEWCRKNRRMPAEK